MNPPLIAVAGVILSVAFHLHLAVTTAGMTLAVSVPVLLFAAAIASAVALAAWIARHWWRSSPYPRTVA